MCKKSKMKIAITAGLLGALTAGAIVGLCSYGAWRRVKAAEERAQEEREKERMAAEGGVGGNASAAAHKA